VWHIFLYATQGVRGYTARMMRLVIALVFIATGLLLGFSVVPEMVANMLLDNISPSSKS
jgi:hypothetical protein